MILHEKEKKYFFAFCSNCGATSLALYAMHQNGEPNKFELEKLKLFGAKNEDEHLEKMAQYIAENLCAEYEGGSFLFHPDSESKNWTWTPSAHKKFNNIELLNPNEFNQLTTLIDKIISGEEISNVYQKIERFN